MTGIRRAATLLTAAASTSVALVGFGAAPAFAKCYPPGTSPSGPNVVPCASMVNDCLDTAVYFATGPSGGWGEVHGPQYCL